MKYTLYDGASVTFGSFRHSRGLAAQASPVECGSDLVAQARSSDDGRCVLALLGVLERHRGTAALAAGSLR